MDDMIKAIILDTISNKGGDTKELAYYNTESAKDLDFGYLDANCAIGDGIYLIDMESLGGPYVTRFIAMVENANGGYDNYVDKEDFGNI